MLIEIRLFGGITVENRREISSVVNVNDVNTCTCINGKLSKCVHVRYNQINGKL